MRMRRNMILGLLLMMILSFVVFTTGCGESNSKGQKIEGGIYMNEELKFSFYVPGDMSEYYKVSEDDWVFDGELYLDRKTVNFFMKYPEGQARMFSINVYNGKFDENDLAQANPRMEYLAHENGYTYTVDFASEAPEAMQEDKAYLNLYNDYMSEYIESIATYISYNTTGIPTEDSKTEQITINIEGTRETVTVTKYTSDLGFTIGYDTNYMAPERIENAEKIVVLDYTEKAGVPDAYLSISKLEGLLLEDAVTGLTLQHGYVGEVKEITIGKENYPAKTFTVIEGQELTSPILEYYILEYKGETYLIQIGYFQEIAEGFGARLHALLYTLKFNH